MLQLQVCASVSWTDYLIPLPPPPSFIWIRIYSTAFLPKRPNWEVSSVEKTAVSVLSGGDEEPGFWKETCIAKEVASVRAALAQVLTPVNAYTGLPVRTREALRYVRPLGQRAQWLLEGSGRRLTIGYLSHPRRMGYAQTTV